MHFWQILAHKLDDFGSFHRSDAKRPTNPAGGGSEGMNEENQYEWCVPLTTSSIKPIEAIHYPSHRIVRLLP